MFHRRLHGDLQRQALTVVLLSVAAVAISTVAFMVFADYSLDQSLFEVTSAFATVGLSTGITADLYPGFQLLIALSSAPVPALPRQARIAPPLARRRRQGSMIRRYIIRRNNHAVDERLPR
nr:potassium transporter TrkG [Streptomyces sp. NEAU-S7GS2]